jgi:hypothetical protein
VRRREGGPQGEREERGRSGGRRASRSGEEDLRRGGVGDGGGEGR